MGTRVGSTVGVAGGVGVGTVGAIVGRGADEYIRVEVGKVVQVGAGVSVGAGSEAASDGLQATCKAAKSTRTHAAHSDRLVLVMDGFLSLTRHSAQGGGIGAGET
jgi:hypothetical protein